jgi:hypothetical protein
VDQNVTFAGYWGGIAVDPVDDTFWAAHQYALPIPDPPPTVFWANWGTWIASFSVTGSELAAPWVASSRSPFVIREEPVADFVATEKESAKPPAAANGLPLANGEEPVSCLQRFTQPRTSNNAKTIETTTLFARIVDLLMSEFE